MSHWSPRCKARKHFMIQPVVSKGRFVVLIRPSVEIIRCVEEKPNLYITTRTARRKLLATIHSPMKAVARKSRFTLWTPVSSSRWKISGTPMYEDDDGATKVDITVTSDFVLPLTHTLGGPGLGWSADFSGLVITVRVEVYWHSVLLISDHFASADVISLNWTCLRQITVRGMVKCSLIALGSILLHLKQQIGNNWI